MIYKDYLSTAGYFRSTCSGFLTGLLLSLMCYSASTKAEVVNFNFESTIFAGHPFPFTGIDSSAGFIEFGSVTESALILPTVVNNLYSASSNVQGHFSWDTTSPGGPNYTGTDYSFTMTVPGVGATLLQNNAPSIAVKNNDSGRDAVNISNNGVLNSGGISLSNPGPGTVTVDLLADTDFTSNFGNIPTATQMLVRLTNPTLMDFQSSTVIIRDNSQTALNSTALPAGLDLASFPDSIFLIQLEGAMTVVVDPSDYTGGITDPDYIATDAWVTANINSVDLISGGNWNIILLTGGNPTGIPGVTVVSENPAERAGSLTTQSIVTAQLAGQQPLVISSRVNSVVNSRASRAAGSLAPGTAQSQAGLEYGTGLSAGDTGDDAMGVWVSYARSSIKNTLVSTAFNADVNTILGGLDSRFNQSTVVGLALGVEHQDVSTRFNLGSQNVRGYTIAPYIGHIINDTFSIDASAGVTHNNINQDRIQSGVIISGKQDVRRYFASANLNALKINGPWVLSGSTGMVWARDTLETFTESNGLVNPAQAVKLLQGRLGGEVAYSHSEWEPFVRAAVVWDFDSTPVVVPAGQAQPSNDENEFQMGLGLRYYGDNGVSGSLEWNSVRGRDDVESSSVALMLRMDF